MIKKQILEFVIKNWKSILMILLFLVIAMKNRRDYSLMQKAYETQAESHEAQIEGLKEIHKQEIRKKQKLMEEHMESIAAIEEDYENALEMIEQLREDKRGEYRNKFNQDREQLILDIEKRFGIQYAP
jgi:flagellar biosynthesis/type III secretory pathway M-ring protein FliF/YscJ